MVKATFFESPFGYLHRCVFAGLDTNDKPQWLMVDQGEEMMTLQNYMVRNLLKDEDIRSSCLELFFRVILLTTQGFRQRLFRIYGVGA